MSVDELSLHPEGGRFREVLRSKETVERTNGDSRCALTHIYFSLQDNEVSRFHKVASDEVWNLYEGQGLMLYLWDDRDKALQEVRLTSADRSYCYVVEAGLWQAAKPLNGSVLVGCSVAPGFEFDDFSLIDSEGDVAKRILRHRVDLADLIEPGPSVKG